VPELSVVIPTLQRYEVLRRTLDRLERQTAPVSSFEVLVVADAKERDPGKVDESVGSRRYPVRRLLAERGGASAARNLGWREAEGRLILYLDDDILPSRRLVAEHLEWHRRHPSEEVGVLGRVQWARGLKVTPLMRWVDHGIQFDYRRIRGEEAGWGRLYTANVSLKRALVARVGGFDEESLPFGYEDLDLGYRLNELGFRLLYNRRALAEHWHPMTLDFWRRRVTRAAVSERRFVRMHPDVEPFFLKLFQAAAAQPPARGRGARLIGVVPRWVPWIGPKAWASADLAFRQALAPHFLAAWEADDPAYFLAEHEPGVTGQSDASAEARASNPAGSWPGGPK
jgi:GT2 family glycosyltransferase